MTVTLGENYSQELKLTFNTQQKGQLNNRLLRNIRRNMGHQRQILHQPTRLSLRRITRAKHPPLTRLQRSRPAHFPRLFKLTRYPCHHPQSTNITKTAQDVCNTSTFHLETLERPVSGGDGADEPGSDVVTLELESLVCVEFGSAGGLF